MLNADSLDAPGKKVSYLTIGMVGLLIAATVIGIVAIVENRDPTVEFVDSDNDGIEDSEDVLPSGDAWVSFQIHYSYDDSAECNLYFYDGELYHFINAIRDSGIVETAPFDWPDNSSLIDMRVEVQGVDESLSTNFQISYEGSWDMPENSYGLSYTVTVMR